MPEEVLDQFYEHIRDNVGPTGHVEGELGIIEQIVLVGDNHGTGENDVDLVTLDNTDDETGEKDFSYEVDHGDNKVVVTAVVSPSHTDVPNGEYKASRLEDTEGNDVTQEVSHTNVTLEVEDDELTSIHEVQIPQHE